MLDLYESFYGTAGTVLLAALLIAACGDELGLSQNLSVLLAVLLVVGWVLGTAAGGMTYAERKATFAFLTVLVTTLIVLSFVLLWDDAVWGAASEAALHKVYAFAVLACASLYGVVRASRTIPESMLE